MTAEIPVHRGGVVVDYALVDAGDFDRLNAHRWRMTKDGYVYRNDCRTGATHSMQREVVGLAPGEGKVVHHLNEEKFDNRRANLEVFETASDHARAPHPKKDATILAWWRARHAEQAERERNEELVGL